MNKNTMRGVNDADSHYEGGENRNHCRNYRSERAQGVQITASWIQQQFSKNLSSSRPDSRRSSRLPSTSVQVPSKPILLYPWPSSLWARNSQGLRVGIPPKPTSPEKAGTVGDEYCLRREQELRSRNLWSSISHLCRFSSSKGKRQMLSSLHGTPRALLLRLAQKFYTLHLECVASKTDHCH